MEDKVLNVDSLSKLKSLKRLKLNRVDENILNEARKCLPDCEASN